MKIRFELSVITEKSTKGNSRKPINFWKKFIMCKVREVFENFLIITAITFVFVVIVYSDKLIKQTLEWLMDILKDI
jgi:hypothetical protein